MASVSWEWMIVVCADVVIVYSSILQHHGECCVYVFIGFTSKPLG